MADTTIELDIVIEDSDGNAVPLPDILKIMLEGHGAITASVRTMHGPTGWPLVAFTGDADDLEGMLNASGFTDPLETYEVR